MVGETLWVCCTEWHVFWRSYDQVAAAENACPHCAGTAPLVEAHYHEAAEACRHDMAWIGE